MELDIIVLKDGLYQVYTIAKDLTECYDYCDLVREQVTIYFEKINRHIITEGKLFGAEWVGCMCR